MISVLLLQRIAQLFVILIIGWVLVRARLMRTEESYPLSILILYLASPCAIFGSFQILNSPERRRGLLIAFCAAGLLHILLFVFTHILRRPLRLGVVDRASILFPNAGGLAIPIISAVLGKEYVLYTCAFITIQQILLWTYGKKMIGGGQSFSFKKMVLNPNIIATLVGLLLFLSGLRLPNLLLGAVNTAGDLLGPLSMLVAGMLLAGMDLKSGLLDRSIWKVSLLRLVIYPLMAVALLRLTGMARLVPDGEMILTVSLLSAAGPSAAMVISMVQAYGDDPARASAINALSTLLCILTIPTIVFCFQWH